MKKSMRVVLVALLVSGCAVFAQNRADTALIQDIPKAFAAAWAKHDGRQLAKIMAEDVDFVDVSGDWLHGREDFEMYQTRLLSGRFSESTLTPLNVTVRFLRPDLAVLHWSWKVQGDRNEDRTARKPGFGMFTMIAEKQEGRWMVVVAQNTKLAPEPNPELNGIETPIVFPNEAGRP
jgi:uncharacterized protein (TIGR02246 family)